MLRRNRKIILTLFLISVLKAGFVWAERPLSSTNLNNPSNGDLVYRDLNVFGATVGHVGISWATGPNDTNRYVIQASSRGYTVGIVAWDTSTPNFLDARPEKPEGEEYWGAYSLNDVNKTIRHTIIYEAKQHIGIEEYPVWTDFLSKFYKNPSGNPYFYDPFYPNGSFRCDGFAEYIYEIAFGDPWEQGNNKGIFPNDDKMMSPEGQMEYVNNEAVAQDGHNNSYHGGGKDGYKETNPPSIQIVSGPSGWINGFAVFNVTGNDNFTATEDLFYRVQFVAIEPNPHGNSSWSWSNWSNTNTWSGPSAEGGWRFEVQSRDLVGNISQSTPWQTFGIDATAPSNATSCNAWKDSNKNISIPNNVTQTTTANPYFEWSGASDSLSGVAGYSVYYGISSTGEPGTTKEQTNASYDAGSDPGSTGTYYLRVRTFDNARNYSAPVTLFIVIYSGGGHSNSPPNKPATPSGPNQGYVNVSYTFTSSVTDPDNDQVRLRFYWGNDIEGQTWAPQSGYAASGSLLTASHSFSNPGTYDISVIAEDEHGVSSEERSDNLTITIGLPPSLPEIGVFGKGIEIVNGDYAPSTSDDTDFGSLDVNSGSVIHTFTIQNTGNAELNLTGSPKVTLSNTSDFTVITQPSSPVTPGNSTTFQIKFDPTTTGTRTCTITIPNNDSDEGNYTFSIQGTGTTVAQTFRPIIKNNIIGNNNAGYGKHGIAGYNGANPIVSYNDVYGHDGGNFVGTCTNAGNNFSADPLFVAGPLGNYYLSQTQAGQANNSPAVDSGSDTAANLGLQGLTTRTDEQTDAGIVDMGYHYQRAPAVISLQQPNGGERIKIGSVYEIRWSASGADTDHIKLLYSTDAGASYPNVIASGIPNNGTYTWNVPNINSSTVKIKVIAEDSSNNPLAEDESDNNFTIILNSPPVVGTINPSSGSTQPDTAVNFTTTYSDPDGWQDIQYVLFLINSSITGTNCLYARYEPNTNKLYLRDNANTVWSGGYVPESSQVIENSYAKLDCAQTTVSKSGNTLTVSWKVTFKSTFTGKKNSYLGVRDNANAYTGLIKKGTWTINSAPPTVGTITPSSGSSQPDTAVNFTTTYSDPDGCQDIQYALLMVNSLISSKNCLYVYYNQNTNKFYLRNDADTLWQGGYAPGSSNVIQNSYAKLDCAQTTVSQSGNTLTVNWNVTFKSIFTGAKNTYLAVRDDSDGYTGFIKKGTWTVTGAPPAVGTITPSSGSSQPNTGVNFTTTYSDPDGWQDIKYAYILISTSSSTFSNCLYAYYDQNTNKLYLRNDSNTSFLGGFAPGSSNIIQNSYAKLDCAQTTISGSGNTLTINWNITFKSTFTGTKNTYLAVRDDSNSYSGWVQKGSWTINP